MQRLTNKKYKINARGRHLTGYLHNITWGCHFLFYALFLVLIYDKITCVGSLSVIYNEK